MNDRALRYAAFFPNLVKLRGNPYWDLLAASLKTKGIEVLEDNPNTLSLRWLLQNRHLVSVLHYHYIQDEYAYAYHYARLRWVIRFFRNLVTARLLGYRVVWTMHNLKPTIPLAPAWVEQLAHFLIARLSHKVIVHCDTARDILRENYGRQQGVVVAYHPNFVGVYPNTTDKCQARTKLGLKLNSKTLLYFGGIRPNKGIEGLVAAFEAVKRYDLCLIIAGEPQALSNYTQELMKRASKDNRIIFISERVPDDTLQLFFNAVDLVVLPFTSVLTSSSLTLAMSFGKPVIVPNMGCMPDIISSDVGWLYKPGDVTELAQAIELALQCDLEKIGLNAYERIKTYSWDRFAQQTLLAYGLH
jgi:beta-1,4-mannosyltransferase